MWQFFSWSLCNFERTTFLGTFVGYYFCYGSVVQNKLLFEDLLYMLLAIPFNSPYRFVQFWYLASFEEHFFVTLIWPQIQRVV